MKCAKCGALISEGSTVCPGCNTLVSELETNNLLEKENNTTEGVQTAPVVEVAPTEEASPVVEVAPVTDIPTTEPVLENPVSDVSESAPAVVQEQTPVVEVKPEEVPPVVEPAPVAEVTPVVENVPEVIVSESPVDAPVQPVATVTPETSVGDTASILDNPSADTPNDVVVTSTTETPVTEPTPTEAPVPAAETPVVANDNNTIINSVASEVAPTVTNDTPSQVGGNTPTTEVKTEKGNGKVLLVIGIVVVLLVVAAVIGFFLIKSKTGTPMNLFNTTLSVVRSKLNGEEKEIKPTKVNLTFQTNLSSKDASTQELYDKLNKIYLETSAYADVKNEITSMDMLIKYGANNMIDADIFVEKSKAYIKLNGLYDKYLLTEMTEEDTVGTEELIIVMDGYMAAVEKTLKEEYFTESNKTIKLNNEDVEVKANILVINDKNISDIAKSVITDLKANTQFMDAYAKLNEMTKEEALEDLDMSLATYQNTSEWTEDMKKAFNFEITIYTKGLFNTPVGFGIKMPEGTYTIYYTEESIDVYTEVEGKEEKLLDAVKKENKYNVNYYVDEEVLSFIIGYTVEENPTFTKPDTSNNVKLEELSEEDMNQISMALMTNEGVTAFMTDFADVIQMIQMLMGNGMMGEDMMNDNLMNPDDMYVDGEIMFESSATMSDDLVLE